MVSVVVVVVVVVVVDNYKNIYSQIPL